MRVLLLQLDGKTPNLALMRLAAHHRSQGDDVTLRHVRRPRGIERGLWDDWDRIYASLIFTRTRPLAERLLAVHPAAQIGGTGWDLTTTLASVGVPEDIRPNYDDYPDFHHSMGFTQRGCRLKCSFCVVPRKEPELRDDGSIWSIWRGDPWPRHLLLLDNDFFGAPSWRKRLDEIQAGRFKVCWNQGFNVRLIGEEEAAAIASTNYQDDGFTRKRLYTAWDNRKDESRLFRNLEALVRHGVKAADILVYMLLGYWHGPKLHPDDFYRQARLREFGCLPFPMAFVRERELLGFQRWVLGFYDVPRAGRAAVPWERFVQAGYEPRKLGCADGAFLFEDFA